MALLSQLKVEGRLGDMSIVVLAGAGQLGSRHLQGLAKAESHFDIYVLDPLVDSINLSIDRWNEVVKADSTKKIYACYSLDDLPTEVDVVIVACKADVRAELIQNISFKTRVNFWVLEKILAQSLQQIELILNTVNINKTWVNTPRKSLQWHNKLKNSFISAPEYLKVSGEDWGLACNAIHFLDMFEFWTDSKLRSIDTTELQKKWVPAKRDGSYEIYGKVRAIFENNFIVDLEAKPGHDIYKFDILESGKRWEMNEQKGFAIRSDGLKVNGRIPYQSEVTGGLIDELFKTKNCSLTTLADSSRMHAIYLTALQKSWNDFIGSNDKVLPIT